MEKKLILATLALIIVYAFGFTIQKEIHTAIEINASAETVWSELTDFQNYPHWNPFITKVSGLPVKNQQLEVTIKPGETSSMEFKPTIIKSDENKELIWLGKVLIPKLFDGKHHFKIKTISENKVLFIQRKYFTGILVLPLWNNVGPDTKQGFILMNKALKTRAESTHHIAQQSL